MQNKNKKKTNTKQEKRQTNVNKNMKAQNIQQNQNNKEKQRITKKEDTIRTIRQTHIQPKNKNKKTNKT